MDNPSHCLGSPAPAVELEILRMIWEISPTCLIVTDPEGRIEFVNPAFEKITGYSAAEALGKTPRILKSGEHQQSLYKDLWATVTAGGCWTGRLRNHRKDGTSYWADVTISPLRDGEGKTLHYIGIQENVTREEEVRKMGETFFDQPLNLNMIADSEGVIQRVNGSWERALGYSDDELEGRVFMELVHPDDRQKTLREMENLIRGAETFGFENRYRHTDGTYRVLSWFANAPVGSSLLFGVATDVTARNRAEALLKESEENLRNLFESAPVGIFHSSWEGRVLRANPMLARMMGYAGPEELIAAVTDIPTQIYPDPEVRRRVLRELASHDGWVPFENLQWLRKDGRIIIVEMTARKVVDAAGRIAYLEGFVQDITERRHAEEALARAKEEAEEANRAKSEFLANMSHEIRTPMNGVIGMTHLLLDSPLANEQRGYAETVRSSAESLLNILNDILDFSKIEAGRLELERVDFSLSTVLGDCAALLAPRAREQGVAFLCSAEPDVPHRVCGDPGRLRQILLNLAGNALKFTRKGEVKIAVSLDARPDSGFLLRFVLRDTGIGIPADKQALLFKKFSQADASTTRRYGGTGLGLAISKELAERMGGQIGFTSTEGVGSEFWFTVQLEPPIAPDDAAADGSTSGNASVIASLAHTHARILLVEDNYTNQDVAAGILARMGLQVEVAGNGTEALRSLSTERFDLVLMDLQMPEMDGIEATRRIRDASSSALSRDIPVVAMTAHVMPGDRERCLKAGMNDYIEKPFSPARLAEALNRWLPLIGSGERHPETSAAESDIPHACPLILVVEDDSTSNKLVRRLLEQMGYRADSVFNGADAVAAFTPGKFGAILMDMEMPVMDGLAATQKIREAESPSDTPVPIIALTANLRPADRSRCREAGMNDFLSKPFKKSELAERLASHAPLDKAG